MKRSEYIHDSQVVKRANSAVKLAIEKKHTMGVPVVVYDRKTGDIYHLQEDGTKIFVSKRKQRGRYSERVKKQTS